MSKPLQGNEFWLEQDGKTVYIDSRAYRLKVNAHKAVYPTARTVITVFAEPLNKKSEYYKQIKRELGDDWDTDILESSDVVYCSVMEQCKNLATD